MRLCRMGGVGGRRVFMGMVLVLTYFIQQRPLEVFGVKEADGMARSLGGEGGVETSFKEEVMKMKAMDDMDPLAKVEAEEEGSDNDGDEKESASSVLEELNETNFATLVEESPVFWLVMFVPQDCQGTCQRMLADVEQNVADMMGYFRAGIIRVDGQKTNTQLIKKFMITSLPYALVFSDLPTKNPYTHKMYRTYKPYGLVADATGRGLRRYVRNNLLSFVTELNNKNIDSFLTSDDQKKKGVAQKNSLKVLLFSENKKVAPMFKALSVEFHQQSVAFGVITSSEEELVSRYNISKFPSLQLLANGQIIPYKQDFRNYSQIRDFIASYTSEIIQEDTTTLSSFLDEESFNAALVNPQNALVVALQGEENSVDLTSDAWEKFIDKLSNSVGVVKAYAVDCIKTPKICEKFGGAGLRVFPHGDVTGERSKTVSTLEEGLEVALDSLPDLVIRLTGPRPLDRLIMEATQQKKSPIVIFSKKDTVTPLMKGLAVGFKDSALIGLLSNPDDQMKAQFQVTRLPHISALIPNPVDPANPQLTFKFSSYQAIQFGSMTFTNIGNYIMLVHRESYPEVTEHVNAEKKATAPTNDIKYVTKSNILTVCLEKPLCVIGFFKESDVDGTLSEQVQLQTGILKKTAEWFSNGESSPFTFVWTNGLCQSEFAGAFNVEELNMPTVVVLSPKKSRFATFRGLFDVENVRSFLRRVLSGAISTQAMSTLPEMVDRDCSQFGLTNSATEASFEDDDDTADMDDLMAEILKEEASKAEAMDRQLKEEAKKARLEAEKKKQEEADAKNKRPKKKTKKASNKKKAVKEEL